MGYIRTFLALFVLLTLLVHLVPGESFQKYIRFFSEIVLTLGLLSPLLSLVCDSDKFMELIQYEEFEESLSEIARDTQKIEFLQNDYYIREYETAIEGDVTRIAEQFSFTVCDVSVHMTEEYTLDKIDITITNEEGDSPVVRIGREQETETSGGGHEHIYAALRSELAEYYHMDESMIEITYYGIG